MHATFGNSARSILHQAFQLARRQSTGSQEILPGHILLAFLDYPEPGIREVLAAHCNVVKLRRQLQHRLNGDEPSLGFDVRYSSAGQQVLERAFAEAAAAFEQEVRPIHLLRGLFQLDISAWASDPALAAAHEAGIDFLQLKNGVLACGTA